jgi:hypothetical protein
VWRLSSFEPRIATVGQSKCSHPTFKYRQRLRLEYWCLWITTGVQSSSKKKKISIVWVRKRIIPTERPPLVGEVIANFLRIEGATWSAWRIPTAVFTVFLDRSRYFFFQVAPQLYSRGWVDPVPDPLLFSLFFFGGGGNLVVPGIEPGPLDL